MKPQTCLLLLTLLVPQQALTALGVSEKSVKNWDDKKLCENKQKWFFEGDKKAHKIVLAEITQRPSIDLEQCEDVGRAWALEEYKLPIHNIVFRDMVNIGVNSKASSDLIKKAEYRKFTDAVSVVYQTYGEEIYLESFRAACGKESADLTATALAMIYITKRGGRLVDYYPSTVDPRGQSEGFGLAMRVAANLNPNFCSEEGIPLVEQRIKEMVQVVYNTQPSFAWPEISRGTPKKTVLKDLPKPSHEEQLGDVLALHFCPPSGSEELLSLYFFNEALLAHQVSEVETDCASKAPSKKLERPEVIEAMLE